MLDLAVVGCGDVAFRTYFAGLAPIADRARVVACYDPTQERAERAAALFPGAAVYRDYPALLGHGGVDAILNFTPAPLHREVSGAALEAGLHVYSEKPLAGTLDDARALTGLAEERGKLLLCAPAVMATRKFRWLKDVIAAGRLGRLTLAVGQLANMGPAGWRAYTGDPRVFYGPGVGPLIDTGVYLLHAITGLFGPAKRVQALGGIAVPRRTILIERFAGETVEVTANDHMLLQLDFGDAAFAQLLSSFAVPGTKARPLEIHGTEGSVSLRGDRFYDANGPFDFLVRDDGPLGVGGWLENVSAPSPSPYASLIACGVPHFVACLEGTETPILTAAHATHVLDIILKAGEAVASGRTLDLETTF